VPFDIRVEGAWFQRLKLQYDTLLSSFGFSFILRPYNLEEKYIHEMGDTDEEGWCALKLMLNEHGLSAWNKSMIGYFQFVLSIHLLRPYSGVGFSMLRDSVGRCGMTPG